MAHKLFALVRTLVIAPLFVSLWLYFLPRWIAGRAAFADPRHLGWIIVAIGAVIGLPSVWEFAWRGLGTPAPFDPPRKLVITGPYRYVRNPMYVGMGIVMLGFAVVFPHAWKVFAGELIFAFIAVSTLVIAYEEPVLRKMFGADYEEYCRNVGRWIPRLSPWYAPPHLD